MKHQCLSLPLALSDQFDDSLASTIRGLEAFDLFGKKTQITATSYKNRAGHTQTIPTFINEFWTAKQRAASSLHEISYRACFKPQLPRFFIERFTQPGDVVHDPFMGRGTTLIEAALLDRLPSGCDANPLSQYLVEPRLSPPAWQEVAERLSGLDLIAKGTVPQDLLVFYHPETLKQICALRDYLLERQSTGAEDAIDRWIRMVSINRLTGHSPGFFSVYTLPPNQAVSVSSQKRINQRRQQTPPLRDVKAIILKKSAQLLADLTDEDRARLNRRGRRARIWTSLAEQPSGLRAKSVSLVVTSPPFLNIVNYAQDNWLRGWFAGLEPESNLTLAKMSNLQSWGAVMEAVLLELHRVVRPGGMVAFEVGEVRKGQTRLEETILPASISAGWSPCLVMINAQQFTKTANCWGVDNNTKGTNTNRIVLLQRQ